MRNDLVSVIVPAYNAVRTITATLESALAQTHRALEVVVVDDGSTDGTEAAIAGVARRDRRVRYLSQPNAGVAAARNRALELSTGAFIAPLDADDIWHPTKIEKQLARMQAAGPQVGVVYCHSRLIDVQDQVIETWPSSQQTGDVFTSLLHSNFIRSASIPLIRRRELELVGGYDSSLRARGGQGCEDLKLYLMLAERCHFDRCGEFLVGYRSAHTGMSSNAEQMRRSWELVMGDMRARHPELPERLFAWSSGNFHRWLGFDALSYGRVSVGLRLLARAGSVDPVGTFRPVRAMVASEILLGRLAERIGAKGLLHAAVRLLPGRARRQMRPSFWEVDPLADDGGLPAVWELRRAAVAASMRRRAPADATAGPSPALDVARLAPVSR